MALGLLSFVLGALMFWKASKSKNQSPEVGLVQGQFRPCGPKPNCVSSQAEENSKYYVSPITNDEVESIWGKLPGVLQEMGLRLMQKSEIYLHFTAQTPLMGFVDDVEVLYLKDKKEIHFRSQSRVGYSDLGANRKRVEKIKAMVTPH